MCPWLLRFVLATVAIWGAFAGAQAREVWVCAGKSKSGSDPTLRRFIIEGDHLHDAVEREGYLWLFSIGKEDPNCPKDCIAKYADELTHVWKISVNTNEILIATDVFYMVDNDKKLRDKIFGRSISTLIIDKKSISRYSINHWTPFPEFGGSTEPNYENGPCSKTE